MDRGRWRDERAAALRGYRWPSICRNVWCRDERSPTHRMLAETFFPPGPFSISYLRFDSRSDRCCDLVLYLKYILELTVVLFCPDLLSAFGFHQLRRDADARSDPADAALDNVVHAEVVPDPAHVAAVSLEGKRRTASDNEERAVLGERCNDVFCYAVRKVLLLGITAEIVKWKNCDARLTARLGQR